MCSTKISIISKTNKTHIPIAESRINQQMQYHKINLKNYFWGYRLHFYIKSIILYTSHIFVKNVKYTGYF